jgi:phosphatidylserine decarboxylase
MGLKKKSYYCSSQKFISVNLTDRTYYDSLLKRTLYRRSEAHCNKYISIVEIYRHSGSIEYRLTDRNRTSIYLHIYISIVDIHRYKSSIDIYISTTDYRYMDSRYVY